MKKLVSCAAIALLPVCSFAQSTAADASTDASQASRWRLGLGVVAADHAYVGAGAKVTPFPLVEYKGEHFFIAGASAGFHLLQSRSVVLDAIVSTGFGNIKADDFDRWDLARRGINRDLLDDRDRSIDAGLALTWRGNFGRLRLEAKSDVSGKSDGGEYRVEYSYPMRWGSFRIAPTLGATYLSANVANYYYGIHADEVRRGLPSYSPGSAWIPEAGIGVSHPMGSRWAWTVSAKYLALPNRISDSPLIDGKHGSTVFFGISRGL